MHNTVTTSIVVLLLGLTSARADNSAPLGRIAVLDLRLVNAPPALKDQVKEKLLEALRKSGYEPLAPNDEDAVACFTGPCLVDVGRRHKAPWVLTAGITAHGTSYDILLTLQQTASGTLLAQVSRRCDVCTYNDAAAAVQRAGTEVVAAARAFVDRQGWLVLSSKPSGAAAQLDGKELGVTPLRRLATTGRHRLSLSKGELGLKRMITIEPRKENVLQLQLRPNPGAHDDNGRGSWGWLGLVIAGLGAGSGTAGAILWSNDHEVSGAALVGAGISAVVSGTIMFFTSSSND